MKSCVKLQCWQWSLLLAFAAIALVVMLPARAMAAPNTSWYVGHESDESFVVTNVLDLQGLAELVNQGADFEGKTVVFEPAAGGSYDLRLSAEWTPIGTAEHPFMGSFDGNGLRITGLSITEGSEYVGFFWLHGRWHYCQPEGGWRHYA